MTARFVVSPRSASARLALTVALAFLLASSALGAGLYYAVSQMLARDVRELVRDDAAGLADLYARSGRTHLLAEMHQRIEHPDDPDAVYALLAPDGQRVLASPELPAALPTSGTWLTLYQHDTPQPSRMVVHRVRLSDGESLITGVHTRSQDGFLALMKRAAALALLAAVVLALLAGSLTARWVGRRLRMLDATAARVGAGELGLRAPVDGSDDAFDRLSLRFNAMLDRIETLLDGVRHATDHIAHDLRTPLNRLRNRLERLRGDPTPDAQQVDLALAEADQMLQSFAALLRLARIEAQDEAVDTTRVDLQSLLHDAVEMYAPVAAERDIRITERSEPLHADGNADQLFQLLVNLLDNAIKYAPANSDIDVRLFRESHDACFEIRDRGPGIPADQRERVFDRFARLETHRATPGLGLGLSLARAIALRHHGRIVLDDNGPGLCVRVMLPRAD